MHGRRRGEWEAGTCTIGRGGGGGGGGWRARSGTSPRGVHAFELSRRTHAQPLHWKNCWLALTKCRLIARNARPSPPYQSVPPQRLLALTCSSSSCQFPLSGSALTEDLSGFIPSAETFFASSSASRAPAFLSTVGSAIYLRLKLQPRPDPAALASTTSQNRNDAVTAGKRPSDTSTASQSRRVKLEHRLDLRLHTGFA